MNSRLMMSMLPEPQVGRRHSGLAEACGGP
jgi:hypothetical protein